MEGFEIRSARFTDLDIQKKDIQKKIDGVSHKGRGITNAATDGGSVVSNFHGQFRLGNGTITFKDLAFDMPGALVQLNGGRRFAVLPGRGGSVIPITISGTKSSRVWARRQTHRPAK